jgi:hypothetical protein
MTATEKECAEMDYVIVFQDIEEILVKKRLVLILAPTMEYVNKENANVN